MMETGQFRKDLYFRLGVIKVKVPSLNQRPDDIMPLAKHFLIEFSEKLGKGVTGISSEAQAALMQHTWTGNVRELKNVMEAAAIVSNSAELMQEDLDASFKVAASRVLQRLLQTSVRRLFRPRDFALSPCSKALKKSISKKPCNKRRTMKARQQGFWG